MTIYITPSAAVNGYSYVNYDSSLTDLLRSDHIFCMFAQPTESTDGKNVYFFLGERKYQCLRQNQTML